MLPFPRRLVPEHPFPIPFEDSYAAVKWVRILLPSERATAYQEYDLTSIFKVAENASELQVDLKKGFIVGGDSAGANLSAAIALKARDDPFFSEVSLLAPRLQLPGADHGQTT